MIRELINFMNDLMSDIPNIMEWKSQPDKGLHVFIDIDSNGVWINKDLKKGKNYDYFDGKNKDILLCMEGLYKIPRGNHIYYDE